MRKFTNRNLLAACSIAALVLIASLPGMTQQRQVQKPRRGVEVVRRDAEKRVDILVENRPFTSYLYTDTMPVLKKPVLYPLRTARGTIITRGYPLTPQPGERADHPHHIGFWFNYGDVNGLDFWNNSDAIAPERRQEMETIRHRSINLTENGENTGKLEVTMDWLKPDGIAILREDTRFVFHTGPNMRGIDRITTLTALDERVSFRDNKEGLIAMRVCRALEHPTNEPIELTDASGKITKVPAMDNTGVTGMYTSSQGLTGSEVWGKRAAWVMLAGVVAGDSVTVAIFDHPQNAGHPSSWHARGYGLFAANPLGQKVFSEGKEELNFALAPRASTTFRHRVLILSGIVSAEQMAEKYREFILYAK
ncbi:MAG: PmoA family protein [bacterium]